ncbi:MAG: serine/threonine protein kinase, partial [Sandaracinaceae bacterium]|nr:serine/threonine protein kinase [Sandaracinaceae bacterium]
MGVVYSATDTVLSNTVAVKLLRPRDDQADNAVERFEREARATARLGHPNIVRVMDMGRTDDGGAFLVMERLAGVTLDEILEREGPLSVERAVRIHLQLLDALGAAHSAGVLHRDVKPSNVFVSTLGDGTELVKLLDFGLAYLLEEAAEKKLTATGIAMGTPAYMSPERIIGEPIDHRADLYSVGVSLYRSLTGELPFRADTPIALRGRILLVEAPMLTATRPDLSGTIADVVARSLAKKPSDRYASAREMATALREALDHLSPSLAAQRPAVAPPAVDRDAATIANATRVGARDLADPSAHDGPTALDVGPALDGTGRPSVEPAEPNEPARARPPTLPLGGVSVPPNAAVAPPVVAAAPVAPAGARSAGIPGWVIGLAIGVTLGALLLGGLYVLRARDEPPAGRPEPAAAYPPATPVSDTAA